MNVDTWSHGDHSHFSVSLEGACGHVGWWRVLTLDCDRRVSMWWCIKCKRKWRA